MNIANGFRVISASLHPIGQPKILLPLAWIGIIQSYLDEKQLSIDPVYLLNFA